MALLAAEPRRWNVDTAALSDPGLHDEGSDYILIPAAAAVKVLARGIH